MADCTRCGKSVSVLVRDLATGLCADCRRDDAAESRVTQRKHKASFERRLETERAQRAASPPREPTAEPLDGLVLIGISIAMAIIGGFLLGSDKGQVFGFIVLGVAGMLYLAGVIRWAVSGSQLLQLNRLHRQNLNIIEWLELIACGKRNAADMELLRRLRDTGQLTDEEYRKQRRDLLRD